MSAIKFTRVGSEVQAVFVSAGSGWRWTFAHPRSTEGDAENLRVLLQQHADAVERGRDSEVANLRWRVQQLERSNASLRGHLRRLREKGGAS